MKKKFINKKGATSLYLMLILTSVITVVWIFIHQGALLVGKSYSDAVLELSGRSILSEYDIELQKRYGIFAFKGEEKETEEKLRFYINYGIHENVLKESLRIEKYFDPLKLSLDSVKVDLKGYSITNLDVFETQLIEAMKYDMAKSIIKKEGRTAESVNQINSECKNEIKLKNEQVTNNLPSFGFDSSSIDIKSLIKNGIPNISDIKNSSLNIYYVDEYIMLNFLNNNQNPSNNQSIENRKTFFTNEIEYILQGKYDNQKNYKAVRIDLVILRTGLNMTHIYSDTVKRKQVAAMASILTPGPEALATGILITALWAAAEAENDVRLLEADKNVELVKKRNNWALDLESVIKQNKKSGEIKSKERIGYVEPISKRGLKYEDYLRILLFFEKREIKLLRTMDLIQLNMMSNYNKDFVLKDYYGGLEYEAVVKEQRFVFVQKY